MGLIIFLTIGIFAIILFLIYFDFYGNGFFFAYTVCMLLVFIFGLGLNVREYNFEQNCKTELIKPEILLVKNKEESVVYLLNDEVKEFYDIKWLNTNHIYLEIKSYKGRTNKEYKLIGETK